MADIFLPQNNEASGGPVITARGVCRHFGPIRAVDGIDLTVAQGELFGLIGHNGAGKSTLFKMMLGLVPVTSGEILINGVRVDAGEFRVTRRQIGYLPENVVFYDNLTGLETLHFFARLKGVDPADATRVLDLVALTPAMHRRVREYSKGMRQRLGIAQALLGNPRLLFLDEPTTGLDPEAIRAFYVILQQLRSEGVTMVITSHILTEIQERVDRLAIMADGKVRAAGTVRALREQQNLPLRVTVYADPADFDTVRRVLCPQAVLAMEEHQDRLTLQCRRETKMAVLAALTGLGEIVRDVTVREPSLEDLFFGLAA